MDSKLCERKNSDPLHLNPFGSFWHQFIADIAASTEAKRRKTNKNQARYMFSFKEKRNWTCSQSRCFNSLDTSCSHLELVGLFSKAFLQRRPKPKALNFDRLSALIGLNFAWNVLEQLGTAVHHCAALAKGWQRMASDPQILKALDPI